MFSCLNFMFVVAGAGLLAPAPCRLYEIKRKPLCLLATCLWLIFLLESLMLWANPGKTGSAPGRYMEDR